MRLESAAVEYRWQRAATELPRLDRILSKKPTYLAPFLRPVLSVVPLTNGSKRLSSSQWGRRAEGISVKKTVPGNSVEIWEILRPTTGQVEKDILAG